VRPVDNPAAVGGGGGTAPPTGGSSGKVNLDGTVSGPGGNGSVQPPGTGNQAPLNLDLHGGGNGPSLGRTRSGLVPALPAPAEKKTPLETELERANRAHCADAYASNGLLAVIPLAKDAVTGKGCKW
jgi:hypothetical protein